MLVAYRLADLSALEGHYAGVRVCAQFGAACGLRGSFLLGIGERGRPMLPRQTPTSLNASRSGRKNQKIGRQKQAGRRRHPYIVGQSNTAASRVANVTR
jgi:hypothetical protein